MNRLFAIKYDELLTEFNRYVMEHPDFLAKVPDEALIVLLDRSDPEFCRYNLARIETYKQNDDRPNRPVIYVDVGQLAPIRSRMVSPRILSRVPNTLAA